MRPGRSKYLDGTMLTARVSRERSLVKSIQRGVITITNTNTAATATITAVDVNNTMVLMSQDGDGTIDRWDASVATLVLTNSTTLTATRTTTTGDSCRTSYEVIEFWPGVIKSVQRGTIALTGVTSNTATVTAVDMDKSSLSMLGMLCTDLSYPQRITTRLTLTNATTITASRAVGTNNVTISYQLVEFY